MSKQHYRTQSRYGFLDIALCAALLFALGIVLFA